MRLIPLTRGKHAMVDDGDFERLSRVKWRYHNKGYAVTGQYRDGSLRLMHRVVAAARPGEFIDHRDTNKLNNQRGNLRKATPAQNCANKPKQTKRQGNAYYSRFKGVTYYKRNRKWGAYIKVDGDRRYLGVFDYEDDAARAYNRAAKKLFGEFALLNKV